MQVGPSQLQPPFLGQGRPLASVSRGLPWALIGSVPLWTLPSGSVRRTLSTNLEQHHLSKVNDFSPNCEFKFFREGKICSRAWELAQSRQHRHFKPLTSVYFKKIRAKYLNSTFIIGPKPLKSRSFSRSSTRVDDRSRNVRH